MFKWRFDATLHCNDHVVDTGRLNRGQLSSRQGSSNSSYGNNRESSLDDSGVVDDHEEADGTSEDVSNLPLQHILQVVKNYNC